MKKNFLVSCLLVGTIVSSCSSNQEDDILSYEQPTKFNVSLTSSNEVLKTRSNTTKADDSESTLSHVAFYVFKESGSLETSIAATNEQINNGSYTIDCTTGKKYIYAITNDQGLFTEIKKGTQRTDFEARVTKSYLTAPISPLTMVGKYPDLLNLAPSTDGSTPSATIKIDVTRLAGKVTVKLGTEAATKFELKQFKIANANPQSNYFLQQASYKPADAVSPIPGNYTDQPAFNTWTDSYYIDNYAYVANGQTAYALENWNPDPRRGNTTCIIIQGSYKGGADTYYRFNLGGKAVSWAFNRNTHYQVTISDVYEDGYTDEGKAEKPEDGKPTDPLVQDVKLSATLQITPWVVVNQDDEIGKE